MTDPDPQSLPADETASVNGEPAEPAADQAGTPVVETPPEAPTEDWHDRYLRLAAEFDNFRKRSAREFGELVRTAERDLILELTEVLDNLGRAADADHKGESVDQFAKGVALIRDQLRQVLERRGLEQMQCVGSPFDPEQHDAMLRMPSDDHAEGLVAQEVSPGYRLGGKVLRHAKVIVSQGKAEENQEP
ncbi:MAG: nucleotide exchange factor GrpE [Candidatus Zixiibacteriota bacterium]